MSSAVPTRRQLLTAGLAAFAVYFAMYAFRKPVTAVGFADQAALWPGLDYKATIVIAQAIGYALSKMLGVRVVAAHRSGARGRLILALVALAWGALVGFALLPARFGPVCLFLNGLPLGMIWGLVFRYLEGRRASELLAAMLTASFILSSGVTKSVGALLVERGVSPFAMPALTGMLFAPVLVAALVVLARLPPPGAADEAARGVRRAMDGPARRGYVRAHAVPLLLLIPGYTILTALRDFRDNFAPELWGALGHAASPAIFAVSEVPVTIVVLVAMALLTLVRSNLGALLTIHGAVFTGAVLLVVATLLFRAGLLGSVGWMIWTGIGIYLAYAPFSAVLFDRMMSLSRMPGNAAFLIYLADSFGYAGSVALLVLRTLTQGHGAWLGFFERAVLVTGVVLAVASAVSAAWFARRHGRTVTTI